MSYIEQLLNGIAQEVNKPTHTVKKFITLLEENWYDSEIALKEVSENELTELGIPRFLAKKIKQKVDNPVPMIKKKDSVFGKKQEPIKSEIKSEPIIEEVQEPMQNKPKKEMKVEALFKREIEGLINEILHLQTRISSLEIIQKVNRNLKKDPTNTKFHILKTSNKKLQENIFAFRHAKTILQLIGFCEKTINGQKIYSLETHDENLVKNVTVLDNLLNICISQLKQQVNTSFNPYKASFKSNTGDFSVGKKI
jgi:hypothetical protein